MASRPETGSARISSLDGLRAVSILLVTYGHARATFGFPKSLRWLQRYGDVADLGVHVFFIISGYLITSLLLAERRKTGTVKLGAFYVRRAFRISPPYYAYLLVMGILKVFGMVELPWLHLGLAAAYAVNFLPGSAWVVGHAWSLAVEEQFYLMWPAVFRATTERRATQVAFAIVALGPFLRGAMALLFPNHRTMISEVFPTVADSLAAGCLLALLAPRLSASPRYLRWLKSPILGAVLVPTIVFSLWFGELHPWANWLVLRTVICVCVALLVDRYVRFPDGPVGRFLNWGPIEYIGGLSYSFYLWQQLFLQYPARVETVTPWSHFPGNLGLAVIAALASYYLVEKPFLRLRDRVLKRPKTRPKAEPDKPAAA